MAFKKEELCREMEYFSHGKVLWSCPIPWAQALQDGTCSWFLKVEQGHKYTEENSLFMHA